MGEHEVLAPLFLVHGDFQPVSSTFFLEDYERLLLKSSLGELCEGNRGPNDIALEGVLLDLHNFGLFQLASGLAGHRGCDNLGIRGLAQ